MAGHFCLQEIRDRRLPQLNPGFHFLGLLLHVKGFNEFIVTDSGPGIDVHDEFELFGHVRPLSLLKDE
jgi:hypothetical protein